MCASMSSAFVLLALESITLSMRLSPLSPKAYLSKIRPSLRASKLPFWSISNAAYEIVSFASFGMPQLSSN